jgi:hypothetical protein
LLSSSLDKVLFERIYFIFCLFLVLKLNKKKTVLKLTEMKMVIFRNDMTLFAFVGFEEVAIFFYPKCSSRKFDKIEWLSKISTDGEERIKDK